MDLNLETSRLSRITTELAANSLKTAEKTSRITRISVYLFVATSPFIIALQYFTSGQAQDQRIFNLDQTPRTFFLSIGALMFLLLLFTFTLYILDLYKSRLFWIVYGKMSGSKRLRKKVVTGE